MNNITTKQFQQLTDINLVWDFMVEVYDNRFVNGVAAPFFEYALTSSWMDKTYLHLDRLWFDGDKVVAFVFYENPVTGVFFNLRPGYEELAAVALSEHCHRLKPLGAEMMTGGDGEFYKKIGYEDGIHWLHYRKK